MKIRSSTLGFTLTELILVIVLISILSLFAASRFIGKSSFSAFALQEQVISVIRQVQVNRMQSNIDVPPKDHPERCNPSEYSSGEDSSYTNFCLSVTPTCIGSSAACTLQDSSRSDFVVYDSANFSVNNGISPIEFTLLGNPMNSASGEISIWIADSHGQSRCEVKINSQGYVSKGLCL